MGTLIDTSVLIAAERGLLNFESIQTEADDDLWQDEGISPLVPPNRLREKLFSLARVVDSADARPTEQSWEVYRDLARHQLLV